MLRRQTGMLLMDGFFFLTKSMTREQLSSYGDVLMLKLLAETRAPFVIYPWTSCRSLNQFALRRPDDAPLRLPISCLDCMRNVQRLQIGSETASRFKFKPQVKGKMRLGYHQDALCGNKSLYSDLKIY